jgi:hypothetical protein
MKKLFAFISVFLILSAANIFADVSVKKLSDGNVEVTFFYGNPRASEVLLAGDFTNWQNGALPMSKGDKGFSLTKTFKPSDELRYKFISDGNWTTDLKAPSFVDDGFGGKNSHVVIADMLGGDDNGAAKAKINFVSWSMIGLQGNYVTQSVTDATKKGFDLDSVTFGMKSYNKFVGNFLPNCPVYIEIALAEKEMEDYAGNESEKLNYIYRNSKTGDALVSWEDGFKNLVNGLLANPVAYLAGTTTNEGGAAGPGTNPFLGHLKFGFNTPYINFMTGFNYAKPDVRDAITWTTICSSWDAGYQHIGGFNQFSLGSKAVAALEEATGVTFDIGFAPNKTADRKGLKYGYWGWVGAKFNDWVIDFQSNGMYDGLMFDKPVEHDFILGAKNTFATDAGQLSVALQGLVATHQMSSAEIVAAGASNTTDYFGYSTDVFYRSGEFDGIQNMAANARVGFKADTWNVNAEYRLRGAQASMLYLRENHDDGTFDLSETLGVLNSQRIALNASVNPMEALNINLGVTAEMPLQVLADDSATFKGYFENAQSWYFGRCGNMMAPLFGIDSGMELTLKPAVTYTMDVDSMTFGAYADMNLKTYKMSADAAAGSYANTYIGEKYSSSDSPFRVKVAGASFSMKPEYSDLIKGINVYYGLDLSNSVRTFNTLVGKLSLKDDWTVNAAVGLKLENTVSADDTFNADANNPFAFAVGVSKQFKAMKKPTVYAQFVYNMDPFKHFGDGQDALNMNRSNVNGSWQKEGVGSIDAVDWYDGRAAMRVGIRWDI